MSIEKNYEISWTQFELCNANLQTAFENMCRWLFNEFFFDGKALLHSDPNNPGVEAVPVYHTESEKWISFQAKYFSVMDYEQIKHSARTAVSHYAGQLDIIYLYCNKDVTTSSQGYQAVESILSAHGIEIVPITNQEILTQVMKSETIAWHFFDYFTLSDEWLKNRLEASLASLGPRYNDEFNVQTNTEMYLNYFLCNADAVTEINRIKSEQLPVNIQELSISLKYRRMAIMHYTAIVIFKNSAQAQARIYIRSYLHRAFFLTVFTTMSQLLQRALHWMIFRTIWKKANGLLYQAN